MKFILLAMSLALFSTTVSGQSFFMVGANYTVLSSVHDFPFGKQKLENFKLTPSIGYGYNFNIKGKWSYQPSVSLVDFGGINGPKRPRTIFYTYAASVDQFMAYRPVDWMSIAVSPTVYYVLLAQITAKSLTVTNGMVEYDDENKVNWKNISRSDLNRLVFAIVPRISFHLKEHWSINLSYRKDITSVGVPFLLPWPYDYTLKGHGVSISLKYQLKAKKA